MGREAASTGGAGEGEVRCCSRVRATPVAMALGTVRVARWRWWLAGGPFAQGRPESAKPPRPFRLAGDLPACAWTAWKTNWCTARESREAHLGLGGWTLDVLNQGRVDKSTKRQTAGLWYVVQDIAIGLRAGRQDHLVAHIAAIDEEVRPSLASVARVGSMINARGRGGLQPRLPEGGGRDEFPAQDVGDAAFEIGGRGAAGWCGHCG